MYVMLCQHSLVSLPYILVADNLCQASYVVLPPVSASCVTKAKYLVLSSHKRIKGDQPKTSSIECCFYHISAFVHQVLDILVFEWHILIDYHVHNFALKLAIL